MNMNIDFEVFKWVAGGVITATFALCGWIVKKIINHMKVQEQFHTETSKFRDDMSHKTEIIAGRTSKIMYGMDQLQMTMEAHFELNPLALFICDNEGMCTSVNDALMTIFRAKANEMLRMGWISFLHPDDRNRVSALWMQYVKQGNSNIRDHYRIIDKEKYETNGAIDTIATVNYKTIFKFDEDGKLRIAIGTVWEVDKAETSQKVIECIAEMLADMKGTPTWMKLQQEIKDKNKK